MSTPWRLAGRKKSFSFFFVLRRPSPRCRTERESHCSLCACVSAPFLNPHCRKCAFWGLAGREKRKAARGKTHTHTHAHTLKCYKTSVKRGKKYYPVVGNFMHLFSSLLLSLLWYLRVTPNKNFWEERKSFDGSSICGAVVLFLCIDVRVRK